MPREMKSPKRTRDADANKIDGNTDIVSDIPAHLRFLISEPQTLPGEDIDEYKTIMRIFIHDIKPSDAIEVIWTKDLVDLVWEARRMRRWKVDILHQLKLQAIADLIQPYAQDLSERGLLAFSPSVDALAAGWMSNRQEETEKVNIILHERGLSAEDVVSHGFFLHMQSIERIDRLIFESDRRRDALLREIERKRKTLADKMRSKTADVIDVDLN